MYYRDRCLFDFAGIRVSGCSLNICFTCTSKVKALTVSEVSEKMLGQMYWFLL